MRLFLLLLVVVLASPMTVWGQAEGKKAPKKNAKMARTIPAIPLVAPGTPVQDENVDPNSVAGKIQAISADFRKTQTEFRQTLRDVRDRSKRAELMKGAPRSTEWVAKMWKVVDAHPGDAATIKGLTWLMRSAGRASGPKKRAANVLVSHHMDSEELGAICRNFERIREPFAVDTLRKIMNGTPHPAVKGQACYSLAKLLKASAASAGRMKRDSKYMDRIKLNSDEEAVSFLSDMDVKAVNAESVALLEEVKKNCGNVPHPYRKEMTLSQAADADLFEMTNLAEGRTAPEIAGEDIDGVAFNLTDYRGKVVMLDFWGNW